MIQAIEFYRQKQIDFIYLPMIQAIGNMDEFCGQKHIDFRCQRMILAIDNMDEV